MADSFQAMVVDRTDDGVAFGPRELTEADLPEGDLLVRVEYSSVNYKDALATTADGKVATNYPLVPGIDLAGTVAAVSEGSEFAVGDPVVAIGYDLGVSRHGGYADYARIPSGWAARRPEGLDARSAMAIGTAGFTAAMSVVRIVDHGVRPEDGPVLVTGASGGVGSTAVSILAGLGYRVITSTGKASAGSLLRELGADDVLERAALIEFGARPLGKQQWAAAVDCVGGTTLAAVLAGIRYGGIVAASGLTGGAALPTTVLPFILRGVTLAGIDSVQQPIARRRELWARLGSELRPAGLHELSTEVALTDVGAALEAVRTGQSTGRTIVAIGGPAR